MSIFCCFHCEFALKLRDELNKHIKHCQVKLDFKHRRLSQRNFSVSNLEKNSVREKRKFIFDNFEETLEFISKNENDVFFANVYTDSIIEQFELLIELKFFFFFVEFQIQIYEMKTRKRTKTSFFMIENRDVHYKHQSKNVTNYYSFRNSANSVLVL